MSDENQTCVDLWGNEVYVRAGKKGRPPFEWTQENSNRVSMLLALGWSNERIANCIKDPRTGQPISIPTLKRHFRAELKARSIARDQMVAWQMEAAKAKADDGNVGAMRFFERLVEKNDMMNAEALVGKPEPDPAPKPGKKQIDAAAAEDAEAALEAELQAEALGRPN